MARKPKEEPATEDAALSLLCGYYENSTDALRDSDALSERDRDYYDSKQLTATEISALKKRGQPDVVINRIKPKIDFLLGTERQNRTDPKAFPRTPMDEGAAHAATDAIRYVCDREDFSNKRSSVFDNICVEGTGGAIVEVKDKGGKPYICIQRIAWDRLFYDHHARERDFSDAKFRGIIWWGDRDQAIATFGEKSADLFDQTIAASSRNQTHDDKPTHWVDGSRKRVTFAEIYYLDGSDWKHAVFTKSGFVTPPEDSQYQDDDGSPCNPIEFMSCYVDRENRRYGVVRQLIGPQDEINKRRSKALHLITMRQFVTETGAVDDIQKTKKELANPAGGVVVNPGMRFEILDHNDMAQANLGLLQEAKNEIDASGANAALSGKDTSSSGKELALKQSGGLTELGPVFDALRIWQRNVYKQVWYRVKQYWTSEMWIRVTDDEMVPRFVGLNVATDPYTGAPLEQVQNNVAKMDLDIILDEMPDTPNIQAEQFATLGELYKVNPQNAMNPTGVPFDAVIEASQIRGKEKLLAKMRGQAAPDGQFSGFQDPNAPPPQPVGPPVGPDGQPLGPDSQPQPPMPDPQQIMQAMLTDLQAASQQATEAIQQTGAQIAQTIQQAGEQTIVAIQQAGQQAALDVQAAHVGVMQNMAQQPPPQPAQPVREPGAGRTTDQALTGAIGVLAETMQGMAGVVQEMNRPRKTTVVRGPDGKVGGTISEPV